MRMGPSMAWICPLQPARNDRAFHRPGAVPHARWIGRLACLGSAGERVARALDEKLAHQHAAHFQSAASWRDITRDAAT